MSGHLILLGTPRSLRVSRMRENSFTRLDTDCELTKLAGRDCAAWVKARDDQGKIVLVETTNYLPRQTAIYAQWLLFENEAELEEFLKEFPQYRLDARLAKTREERHSWLRPRTYPSRLRSQSRERRAATYKSRAAIHRNCGQAP
jgi:hypothetical protein